MSAWQDISTAPTETLVFLWGDGCFRGSRHIPEDQILYAGPPRAWVGMFDTLGYRLIYSGGGAWVSDDGLWLLRPTLWQPMPATPAQALPAAPEEVAA